MNTLTFGKLASAPFFFTKQNAGRNSKHEFTGISVIPIPNNETSLADFFTGAGTVTKGRPSTSNQFFVHFYPLQSTHGYNTQVASINMLEGLKTSPHPQAVSGDYFLGKSRGQHLFNFEQLEPEGEIEIKVCPGTDEPNPFITAIAKTHIQDCVEAYRQMPRTDESRFRPVDETQFNHITDRAAAQS